MRYVVQRSGTAGQGGGGGGVEVMCNNSIQDESGKSNEQSLEEDVNDEDCRNPEVCVKAKKKGGGGLWKEGRGKGEGGFN